MSVQNQGLSNLQLSSEYLYVQPGKQSAQLTITNVHHNFSLLFKIKTKIQKIFEVKPTKGLIKPGQSIIIVFKTYNKMEEEQRIKYQQELQFLLQAANRTSAQITKEGEEDFWKDVKIKKADISLGYCSVKIGVKMSRPVQSKVYIPSFTSFQSRVDKKFTSNVKSSQKSQDLPFHHDGQALISKINGKIKHDDDTLSKKYQELKEQHEVLQRERMQMLSMNKGGQKSQKSKINIFLVIIIFIVFLVIGNLIKCLLVKQESKLEEKSFFSFLS